MTYSSYNKSGSSLLSVYTAGEASAFYRWEAEEIGMRIIIASHNQDKIREFHEIIQDQRIEFTGMGDQGFHDEIKETGTSYRENALIKASAVHRALGGYVLADDSGLQLDVLDGFPGIYSARFAGEKTAYPDKIKRLHELLSDYPQEEWKASFHCSLCFIDERGEAFFYDQEVRGLILAEARGEHGFGYDPVFYLPELGKTNAELPAREKNLRSHRGLALLAWYRDFRERYLGDIDFD